MRVLHYLSLLASVSSSLALELANGQLSSGEVSLPFQQSGQSILFNTSGSKVDISFDIAHTRQPDQIFIKLTNSNGLETSFKPITKFNGENFKSKASISYRKLPKLFQSEKKLDLHVIIADSTGDNIFTKIGSIELDDSLIAKSTFEPAERYSAKPEIHHIFQQPPKTVNSTTAIGFSVASVAIFLGLIISWFGSGSLNFKNFQLNLNNVTFVGLIIAYEAVFFQYYLGSTIFESIWKVFILFGPSIWFGSRVLNYVGELRLAGKR